MPGKKRGPKAGTEGAKRGGRAMREKYGSDFYREIGKKGGAAASAKLGPMQYIEIGRKGGESTKARHGSEHYVRIGQLGGKSTRKKPLATEDQSVPAEQIQEKNQPRAEQGAP